MSDERAVRSEGQVVIDMEVRGHSDWRRRMRDMESQLETSLSIKRGIEQRLKEITPEDLDAVVIAKSRSRTIKGLHDNWPLIQDEVKSILAEVRGDPSESNLGIRVGERLLTKGHIDSLTVDYGDRWDKDFKPYPNPRHAPYNPYAQLLEDEIKLDDYYRNLKSGQDGDETKVWKRGAVRLSHLIIRDSLNQLIAKQAGQVDDIERLHATAPEKFAYALYKLDLWPGDASGTAHTPVPDLVAVLALKWGNFTRDLQRSLTKLPE